MRINKVWLWCSILWLFTSCTETVEKKEYSFLPDLKSGLLKNNTRGKLIFTFAALAYTVDAKWGHGKPLAGMERLAGIAHKHHIPVTWLIDTGTGTAMKDKLDEWHKTYGDDIALYLESENGGQVDKEKMKTELDSLKVLFPWSDVKPLAASHRSNEMLQAGKELGLSAVWGSCWEQVGVDQITDRGTPWGFFYASEDNYKLPSLEGKGLVSVEWTSRDLLKSFHTEAPTIYSSDPNDVGRSGLCSGADITYWKTFFDNYIRNISSNRFVFFQQHQEAHEMEYGDVCKSYSPEEIDEAEKMLDAFFAYVKSYDDLVECKTIPDAVQMYNDNFKETEPSVMLFDDAAVKQPVFWYGRENRATGPWPKTLLYYDKECQLAFIEGQLKPKMHRDYVHNRALYDPRYYQSDYQPEVKLQIPWEDMEFTEIPIEVNTDREMPYGITLWYDFDRYKIRQVEGATCIGPVENQVALLRLNLNKGKNTIVVHLEKR
ncbi:MAG: hypothetical protein M9904_11520 [Chitinophagaceae bacterium]|nr:hypothetical protein [Chitinophagaceae bacterium]